MQKGKKYARSILLALLLVALGSIYIFHTRGTLWKLYLPYIDTAHFYSLSEQYHDFVGMDIDDVLRLVTKNDIYIVFDRETTYQGRTYRDWVTMYPEIALNDTSKTVLYCIPLQNSHSREEAFLAGLFVDHEGRVFAPVDLPFSWD